MLKTISLSLLIAMLLLHGPVAAQEKRPQSLRLAYGALSSARIPYWIAKDAKLDEKYGLDLNLVFINGAPVALNALIAGDVHLQPQESPRFRSPRRAGQLRSLLT